jgi:2,3-dihydroxy-p-cumate/2,3-dihydroxybenzoate 3,4-dioxygenase
MIDLHDIRYVRLGTANLANAIEFATKIVGLQLVAREGKSAYFRSDRPGASAGTSGARGETRDHTLVYTEGDPAAHAVGFDLRNPDDLDAVASELERAGHAVRRGGAVECEARRVRDFIAFKDPSGNACEIVVRPFNSGPRNFPARDAGITNFSHIGLRSTDAKRDEAFWTRILNARVSDWIGDAALLRIDTIHHSIALFPSAYPGVQHVNHQVEDVDDVMKSWYFLREQGVKIVFGPGRHPTSGACFLYFEGPDGMVYEYSVGVKHIRPEEEAAYRPRQFPFTPESFCMWGSRPDIPEFAAKAVEPRAAAR